MMKHPFVDYLGGIITCSLLSAGLPLLPELKKGGEGSYFTWGWLLLGSLVAAAFLKDIISLKFRRKV